MPANSGSDLAIRSNAAMFGIGPTELFIVGAFCLVAIFGLAAGSIVALRTNRNQRIRPHCKSLMTRQATFCPTCGAQRLT
jgi:hypothetical protein